MDGQNMLPTNLRIHWCRAVGRATFCHDLDFSQHLPRATVLQQFFNCEMIKCVNKYVI